MNELPPQLSVRRWTLAEFERLAEIGILSEDDRVELIGGELVPMSPKGNRHEMVRGALHNWLRRNLPREFDYHVEPGWRADAANYFEPDFLLGPTGFNPTSIRPEDVVLLIEVAHSSLAFDTTIRLAGRPRVLGRRCRLVGDTRLSRSVGGGLCRGENNRRQRAADGIARPVAHHETCGPEDRSMSARPKLAPEQQLTIEEFLAFTDTRPDGERWELIEGVAIMNPSPVEYHQVVVANIVAYLMAHKRRTGASWLPMPGVGTRVPVSPRSLPQPDVFVKEGAATDLPVTEDALVLFEVLSRSNTRGDQAWRRKVYASVPNCQHYVTVSIKTVEIDAYDRDSGWKKRSVTDVADALDLPALGVSIPLGDIYRWTLLGSG